MKRCNKCGRTYEDAMTFCLEDGAPLIVDTPFANSEDATLINGRDVYAESDEIRAANPWKTAFIVMISAFAVLLIAGLLALKFYNDKAENRDMAVNTTAPPNQIISTPTPKPTPSPTPTPTPTPDESANTNSAAPGDTTDTGDFSEIAGLKKFMSYSQARKAIIGAGWKPIPNVPDGSQSITRDRFINDFKFIEVVSCAGTGLGQCRFEFGDNKGRKLVVITLNNDDDEDIDTPTVDTWFLEDE